MFKYDYEDSIIYWTITTAHALERVMNEELAPFGMTFRQAEVLVLLAKDGPMSQASLAEHMRIEAPTLAGIVDRMERAGWIIRETCTQDRRKKLLRPTDKVEPIWEQVRRVGLIVRARASHGMNGDGVQELIQGLQRIQRNLGPSGSREVAVAALDSASDLGTAAD